MGLGALATYTEANRWLDQVKLKFVNDADAATEAVEADRIIKARLAPVFPDHFALWDATPTGNQEATPGLIQEAAGLLYASYRYSRIYSQESVRTSNVNFYARQLEQRAMDLLEGIENGLYVLTDVSYTATTIVASPDFWPNDTTLVTEDSHRPGFTVDEPDRAFTFDREF